MTPRARYLLVLSLGLVVSLGCPSADNSGPGPVAVDRVTVSPATVNLLVGAQQPLSATALAATGAPIAGKVAAWSSNNTTAATVSATTGLVTAVGPGSAVITAVIDGKTGQATVEVSVPLRRLTVMTSGTGEGTVTSSPAGISCTRTGGTQSGTCTFEFPLGTTVVLTATPGSVDMAFTGWGGTGCGNAGTCQFTMDQARQTTASFVPRHTFTLAATGTGNGTTTSSEATLTCDWVAGQTTTLCRRDMPEGSVVTLGATPAPGHQFTGWAGGGCSGTGACQVTVTQEVTVTAGFTRPAGLSVSLASPGRVVSTPAGIDCQRGEGAPQSGTCQAIYPPGTAVSLNPVAPANYVFAEWGGSCGGGAECVVTMTNDRAVLATFHRISVITIFGGGQGTGRVTSNPAVIDCTLVAGAQTGPVCSVGRAIGTVYTLTATPGPGMGFVGWAGAACAGTGTCQFALAEPVQVVAIFAPLVTVTVTTAGGGNGGVTSTPTGINCTRAGGTQSGSCSTSVLQGEQVTLTATPAGGGGFSGWTGGGCAGTGQCVLYPSAAQAVTATFSAGGVPGLGTGFGATQFVLVNPGAFTMGSNTGFAPEQPAHPVTLTTGFLIQRTEVTQGQWRQVMGTSPSSFGACGDLCPVENVSWQEVQQFLAALNAQDPGKQYRLPTEAEWEFAARAGTTGDYSGTAPLDQLAWYAVNSSNQTHAVAQKLPNAWGLYDVHGNAREWTSNWYEAYTASAKTDPAGPPSGAERVLRGGPFDGTAASVRSAVRARYLPTARDNTSGFRLARSLPSLGAAPTGRSFTVTQNGALPVPQQVSITAATGGIGNLVATTSYQSGSGWLSATLGGANTPATLTLLPLTTNLSPGTYQATVRVSGANVNPVNIAVTLQVNAAPLALNLTIPLAYLTQAVQRPDHGVELVSGRDAMLRVFAVANTPTGVKPRVRAKLWHGNTEVWGSFIGEDVPPIQVNEGSLATSWDIVVPGHLIVPGLRFRVDVDPDGIVPETNEADNEFPLSGSPLPVAVRDMPPFRVRLVPIQFTSSGIPSGPAGNATPGNAESYLTELRRMMPVDSYTVEVRAPFNAGVVLDRNNANGGWSSLLNAILGLRNFGDANFSGYYYGVVRLPYQLPGITGIGYVPPNAGSGFKAAVGWDDPGGRAETFAHEIGHNMGRLHVPCGGAGNPDPGYPHSGGRIGAWGVDLASQQVYAPSSSYDLMSYCSPEWVSDYTWNALVNWRASFPLAAPVAATAAPGDGLLIWGRATPSGLILEPAFPAPINPGSLLVTGAWQVEARDATGQLLASARFDAAEVVDLPTGPESHFAAVLPLPPGTTDQVASIRVSGPAGVVVRNAGTAGSPPPDPVATTLAGVRRRITWDASRFTAALVRDPVSGDVLAIARNGVADIATAGGDLDIDLSDGVRTLRFRIPR